MKTSHRAALSAAVIAMCTLVSTRSHAAAGGNGNGNGNSGSNSTIPTTPIGELSAFPTVVQTGTKPTLDWTILYPSKVSDVAVINPPGTIIITTNNTYVSVQPIGTNITACDSTQGTAPLYTDARMSVNGGAYKQLFYGIQSNVNSAYSLYIKKHQAGDNIDFSGRYVKNGTWSPLYTTLSSNLQIVTLKNGDTPPTNFSLYQSSTLASYLTPYLDGTGKIKIGPMSVIIMMELGQTNHNLTCFDYQDMILLVTFSTRHPNNGHGNNLDGVDSSNPGQGHGGPNGMVDPSGGVDDEIR
ncbi:MAG: hypothetical protein H8M99_07750 [Gloeobacteraceae cyanobacterium ES-bin-144]|nr:hypothetical protein [Verrucomicrobiales bacterium]